MRRRRSAAALVPFLILFVVSGVLSRGIGGLKQRHAVDEERLKTEKRVVIDACGILQGEKSVNGSLGVEEEKRMVPTGPNPLHN